jgi:Zn-finger nucleic acid-binding protein
MKNYTYEVIEKITNSIKGINLTFVNNGIDKSIEFISDKPKIIVLGVALLSLYVTVKLSKVIKEGLKDKIYHLIDYGRRFNKIAYKRYKEMYREKFPDGILEYSVEDAQKHGFRDNIAMVKNTSTVENPYMYSGQVHKGDCIREKAWDKRYHKAHKKLIFLQDLYDKENINNKTVAVYVEEVDNTVATIFDDTAVMKLDLKEIFSIAGKHVLINLSKKGDDIKIHNIIRDIK